MRYYALKNKFNETFNTPFPCENDKLAVYQLRMILNQKNKEPSVIASDFSFYYVGEFDFEVGTFAPVSPLELVSDCSTLIVKEGA